MQRTNVEKVHEHLAKREEEERKREAESERIRLQAKANATAAQEEKRQLILGVLAAVIALALGKLERLDQIYVGVDIGTRFTKPVQSGFLRRIIGSRIRDKREWVLWQLYYSGWERRATLALREDGTIWQIRMVTDDDGEVLLKSYAPLYAPPITPSLETLKKIYRQLREWAIPTYGTPLITQDEIRPLEFPIRDEKLREELGMQPDRIKKQPVPQ